MVLRLLLACLAAIFIAFTFSACMTGEFMNSVRRAGEPASLEPLSSVGAEQTTYLSLNESWPQVSRFTARVKGRSPGRRPP